MAAKKKDILEKGAIVQRDGETYAITPRIPCGLITDFEILRRIAEVAEHFGAKAIKVTSSQRLAILGIKEEDLDEAWKALGMTPGMASGLCIRSVKACPGTTFCKLGQQDSLAFGLELEEQYAHQPTPNKLKIAVSGCPLDCAESHIRDIGLIGTKKGWTVEIGGSAGAEPRLADPIAEGLTLEEARACIANVLDTYAHSGTRRRLGAYLDEVGLEAFLAQMRGETPAQEKA